MPSSAVVVTSSTRPGTTGSGTGPRSIGGVLVRRARVEPDRRGRGGDGGAQGVHVLPVGAHADVGVRGVVPRELGDLARGHLDPEHGAPAVGVRRDEQRRAVRGPRRAAGPAVPARRDETHLDLAARSPRSRPRGARAGRRRDVAARVGGGRAAVDLQRDLAAVRRDARVLVLVVDVGQQRAARAGREVDRHQRHAGARAALDDLPRGDGGRAVGGDVEDAVVHGRAGVAGDLPQLEVGLGGGVPVGVQAARQQARPARAEVVVPVPDRVLLVEDRGDLAVLAGLAALGVGLGVLARGGQRVGEQEDVAGAARDDEAGEPARAARDDAGLAAAGRQRPQRPAGLVVLGGHVGVGPGRGEQQRAVRGELAELLALRRAGEAPGGAGAGRVHLPQGGDEPVGLGVERLQPGDEPRAVRGQRQTTHPGQGLEGVEVVERAAAAGGRSSVTPRILAQGPGQGRAEPGGPGLCPALRPCCGREHPDPAPGRHRPAGAPRLVGGRGDVPGPGGRGRLPGRARGARRAAARGVRLVDDHGVGGRGGEHGAVRAHRARSPRPSWSGSGSAGSWCARCCSPRPAAGSPCS